VKQPKDTERGSASVRLVTHDVEPIVDAVQEVFGHHVVLACGSARSERSLYARTTGQFLIGDLRYASDFLCVADQARSTLILTIPRQCVGSFGHQSYQEGDLLAFNPRWMGRLDFREPGHISNVCIPMENLNHAARMLAGCDFDEEPVFESYLARDRNETRRALSILNFLHSAPEGPIGLTRARELWAMTELLALWPHSLSRHILGVGTAAPASMRRAIDFIEANLDQAIGLPAVAKAARLGLRGLQDGFRKHVGESPGRYIRNRRLDAAYADLHAGTSGNVTEVATRLQFSNPGVFAKYFYDRFGRLPSSVRKKFNVFAVRKASLEAGQGAEKELWEDST